MIVESPYPSFAKSESENVPEVVEIATVCVYSFGVGKAPASIVFPSDNVRIKWLLPSIVAPTTETPSAPSFPSAPFGILKFVSTKVLSSLVISVYMVLDPSDSV